MQNTRHITRQELGLISRSLLEGIAVRHRVEETVLPDVTLYFQGRVKVDTRREYTGVEHSGERESFTREVITVTDLRLERACTDSGDEVETDLDTALLPVVTEGPCCTVEVHAAPRRPVSRRLIRRLLRANAPFNPAA